MESSPSPCKLDHGGLEPNAVAIYEEVMYRMLPLIHSSHKYIYLHGAYMCKPAKTSTHMWFRVHTPCVHCGQVGFAAAKSAGCSE